MPILTITLPGTDNPIVPLASEVRHARWDMVPGFAFLHRKSVWMDQHIRDPFQNLLGAEEKGEDLPCYQVFVKILKERLDSPNVIKLALALVLAS